MRNRISVPVALAILFCAYISNPIDCVAAAHAHAASAGWFAKPADSDFDSHEDDEGWALHARIKWRLPIFTADGVAQKQAPIPFSEDKFKLIGREVTPYKWNGYNIERNTKRSSVVSIGKGESRKDGKVFRADWNVTASGSGTYEVDALAKDPWDIFPSNLSGISSPTYSLFIPFSMLGGQSDTSGSKISSGFGFDVTYATADGSTTLLDIAFNGTEAVVTPTGSFGSSLRFFQLPDATTVPVGSTPPGTEISISDLRSLISSDIDSSGNLMSPIDLGIMLNEIPIPVALMADNGAVAQVGVTARAFESAAVPEPGTVVAGAAAVMICLGQIVRRRRRNTETRS